MKKIFFVLLASVVMFSCGDANKKERKELRSLLTSTFEITNEQMQGMVIDEITTCDGCEFKNDRIYYYYTINEAYLPISQMKAETSVRRDAIKSAIDNNGEMLVLVDMLKKLDDGGFTYIYKGNTTGESVTIDIDY